MSEGQPLLRVVRGEPTPEQLAALIAVVSSAGGNEPPPPAAPSLWSRPALRTSALSTGLTPGPGAWRASSLPR